MVELNRLKNDGLPAHDPKIQSLKLTNQYFALNLRFSGKDICHLEDLSSVNWIVSGLFLRQVHFTDTYFVGLLGTDADPVAE